MKKAVKITFKSLLALFLAVLIAALGYVSYLFLSYSRIEDNLTLDFENKATATEQIKLDTVYTAAIQNIGFGAYSEDYSFFMDGGKYSRAYSLEAAIKNVSALSKEISSLNPDFALFQEVDTDSTRSYHLNQSEMLKEDFSDFSSSFAVNYHSAYLFYPFLEPHGASNSGLLTLSNHKISSAARISLPISESISKFLDLDRCYSKTYFEVEGGKKLVIYNVHLSAYGGSEEIRTAQMSKLFNDMKKEYDNGNYCVAGGDFNHDFTGDSTKKLNGGMDVDFGWAQPFPDSLLPSSIKKCVNYPSLVPTCRNADVPYKEGNFTLIVDGFLVSENVETVLVENQNGAFKYSDHNAVLLKFKLK